MNRTLSFVLGCVVTFVAMAIPLMIVRSHLTQTNKELAWEKYIRTQGYGTEPQSDWSCYMDFKENHQVDVELYNSTLVEQGQNHNEFIVRSNGHRTGLSLFEDTNPPVTFRGVLLALKSVDDPEGLSFTDWNGHSYTRHGASWVPLDERHRKHAGKGELPFWSILRGEIVWNGDNNFTFWDEQGRNWQRVSKN